MMAVVADGGRSRVYCDPQHGQECFPSLENVPEILKQEMNKNPRWFSPPDYGMPLFSDIFHPRQLFTLNFLSDAIGAIRLEVNKHAVDAGMSNEVGLVYANAIATFLAFAVDRCADFNNSLCRWAPTNEKHMNLYGRQAIPMVWDFAEGNLLGSSVGSWKTCTEYISKCLKTVSQGEQKQSYARQQDAVAAVDGVEGPLLVSTDPPYYDNIGYAALSDFFYVWLRKTVGSTYADEFSTVLVPKMLELTAVAERHGGDKNAAKEHFELGFRSAFANLGARMDCRFPLTVYYAFKQSDQESARDTDGKVTLTTGWETLLEALNGSGFQITATWPVRASQKWRMVAMGTNALASYIVLACRSRPPDALTVPRREFLRELRRILPSAVEKLQQANIAPVDLAQAALGPGMAVFSEYSAVMEPEGGEMPVREALRVINNVLAETLEGQETDFDSDTRWAVAWFKQNGFAQGEYGMAEELARAQAVSVKGLENGGIVRSGSGKARLFRFEEMAEDWDPTTDDRVSIWECTSQLARALKDSGEATCAVLLRKVRQKSATLAETSRELAYLLFQICEKNGWTSEALAYNALVVAWPSIENQTDALPPEPEQGLLL